MKKILLSTVILTAFSLSILLFQISCKKEANAQADGYILPKATTSQLGGVIPDGTTILIDANGKISTSSVNGLNILLISKYWEDGTGNSEFGYYIADIDGSNLKKIPISLPSGEELEEGGGKLTPDGKTLIFVAKIPNSKHSIYSCSIDGTNLKLILNGSGTLSNTDYNIEGAY